MMVYIVFISIYKVSKQRDVATDAWLFASFYVLSLFMYMSLRLYLSLSKINSTLPPVRAFAFASSVAAFLASSAASLLSSSLSSTIILIILITGEDDKAVPHEGGEGDEVVVLVDVVHDLDLEEHLVPDNDESYVSN